MYTLARSGGAGIPKHYRISFKFWQWQFLRQYTCSLQKCLNEPMKAWIMVQSTWQQLITRNIYICYLIMSVQTTKSYQWRHEFRSWNTDLFDCLEHVHLPVHLELLQHVAGSNHQTATLVAIPRINYHPLTRNPDSNVSWANVGPTSGRWTYFGPTYIATAALVSTLCSSYLFGENSRTIDFLGFVTYCTMLCR